MRYKILLVGNNKVIINDFFSHMDFSFDCLCSSTRYDDVANHIKYVQPDAIVYCLYKETEESIRHFYAAEEKISHNDIPVFVIGDQEDCDEFEKFTPLLKPTILTKPISNQTIKSTITVAIEKWKKDQESKAAEDEPAKEAEPDIVFFDEIEPVRRHILIVDDDVNVLKMMKEILVDKYDIATAISGKIAMKFLETKTTDLILLDYEMPNENGAEIFAKIKAQEALKDIPVVFLTGVTDREKITEVLSMKPQGYLLKPINVDKLLATIKDIWG